jgi:hypothetical protein
VADDGEAGVTRAKNKYAFVMPIHPVASSLHRIVKLVYWRAFSAQTAWKRLSLFVFYFRFNPVAALKPAITHSSTTSAP